MQTGTNGFTCLVNRDSFFYGWRAFKPTCWDAEGATSYVPVMLRVGELLAADKSLDEIRAEIDAGFPGHYMIYAPGVTSADLGYSREAAQGNASLPFIFRSGAGGAELSYLIIAPQPH